MENSHFSLTSFGIESKLHGKKRRRTKCRKTKCRQEKKTQDKIFLLLSSFFKLRFESQLHGENVEVQNVEEQTIEGTNSRNTKCRNQIQLNKAKYRSDETSKRLNAERTKLLEKKKFASSISFVQNFTFFRNFEQRISPSLKILNGSEWTITQKNAKDRKKSLF